MSAKDSKYIRRLEGAILNYQEANTLAAYNPEALPREEIIKRLSEAVEELREAGELVLKVNASLVNSDSGGCWACECGNNTDDSGFETCSSGGDRMEPDIGSSWDGHYICNSCDIVFRADDVKQVAS